MINIEQLLPLLKKGWVAMDYDRKWWWYELQPKLNGFSWDNNVGRCDQLGYYCFDIEPVEDWTKSLMRCGDNVSDNNQQ